MNCSRCRRSVLGQHVQATSGGRPVYFCVTCAGVTIDELGAQYLHAAQSLAATAMVLLRIAEGADPAVVADELAELGDTISSGLAKALKRGG